MRQRTPSKIALKKLNLRMDAKRRKRSTKKRGKALKKKQKKLLTPQTVLEMNSQEWNAMKSGLNVNISFEEFLQVDDSLATCGILTDAEIVDSVRGVSEDAEEHNDAHTVTTKEAEKAIELLTTFLESRENIGHEGFTALANCRRLIETKKVRRQKSLKDYFYC
ncbi:hypothetical protein AVEN_259461-1 [Araneus ventricosus]|uniref:Uncharacterized protein n=1 Tax=Araneus ventricosus TaxID=182803 RepID=A0A4Y2I264_ARAVE|nr:hypothetical protein AVEN_259461-1 [Araneus ventricosus]